MDIIKRESLSNYHNKNFNNKFIIDSQTRKDLDLDLFYNKYNRTKTSYGDQIFYHQLNSQPNNLEESRNTIAELKSMFLNRTRKNLVEEFLTKIGKQYRGNITRDLADGLSYKPKFLNLIPFWFFLGPVLSVGLYLIFGSIGFIGLGIILLLNLLIFVLTNNKVNHSSGSMNYLIKTIVIASKMAKRKELKDDFEGRSYISSFKPICKYGIFLKDGVGNNGIGDLISSLIDYLRVFLLAELFAYYQISSYVKNNLTDILEMIEHIGYMDFTVNSANIVSDFETSFPEYGDGNSVLFTDLKHPIFDNCVSNNLNIDKSLIITGMNMAGKSTFLKSVGLNQILATSFGFTYSSSFNTNLLNVISSMKVEDDLENSKSKYYVEAERLLYIQNQLSSNRVLCLIDEILTGTNTDDRIEASIKLLSNFHSSKSLILAATHDIQIADELEEYSCYYFDGEINKDKIVYDYKIKQGVVTKRNALELLEKIGLNI